MDTLLAMAIDLATQLQADPRCEAVKAASAAADADEALQALISEFNLKRIAINTEESKPEGEQRYDFYVSHHDFFPPVPFFVWDSLIQT